MVTDSNLINALPISFILSFLKPFNPSTADNINIIVHIIKINREDRVVNIIRN